MEWNDAHRELLYRIVDSKWSDLHIDDFEDWLASLNITWSELRHECESPPGTVAVWEGPGVKDNGAKMCWVVPDDVAHKMLLLAIPRKTPT